MEFSAKKEIAVSFLQLASSGKVRTYEAVRVLEDGDLVAVHGRIRLKPDTPEYVLIHIFRFDGDRIVEEWEAGQEIPGESPNKNGMF